jgi:hypothetical protein
MTPAAAMAAAFCSKLLCWLVLLVALQVTRTARGRAPACEEGGRTQLSMLLLVVMQLGLGA